MELINDLIKRRKELKISYDVLSRRSGISKRTIQRGLRRNSQSLKLHQYVKLAGALGIEIKNIEKKSFKEEEARKKARWIVMHTQGTSALEGQEVDEDFLNEMTEKVYRALLEGTPRKVFDVV